MLRTFCAQTRRLEPKYLGANHLLSYKRKILVNFSRCSSQLYPTTGRRWDDAMIQAESIVGDSSNFSSLQKWVSGEFSNITKYLQRLVGTNHPMLETAKRCSYISEGKMGSAQAKGVTVILTAKMIESLARFSCKEKTLEELIRNQVSLAEMTEMTYSAYMIHRGVMDLKMHGVEAVNFGSEDSSLEQQAKGIHYGNKVSVLCGDFLLAYVMRGLGDLFSSKVVDLVASAITEFMEGEFLLIDDWRCKNYLFSEESRDLTRWQQRTNASIGTLQANTCKATLVLANIEGKLQRDALEFGRNLGLAWQAHTELQPFLEKTYEPIELPEMPPYPAYDLNCLPVLLFLRDSYKSNKNFRLMLNSIKALDLEPEHPKSFLLNQHRHQEAANYEKLHQLVLEHEGAIKNTQQMVKDYSQMAMRHLDSFPPNEARDALINICESLYTK